MNIKWHCSEVGPPGFASVADIEGTCYDNSESRHDQYHSDNYSCSYSAVMNDSACVITNALWNLTLTSYDRENFRENVAEEINQAER